MPKKARYPLFLAGLLILIVGGSTALLLNAPLQYEEVLGVDGFFLIFLSIATR
ncbi:MAG: hypothetical protein OK422_00550 [Thaumarchaeota archaeon]|nr:hypothetical protein [Nitrososphaerota archaeon]